MGFVLLIIRIIIVLNLMTHVRKTNVDELIIFPRCIADELNRQVAEEKLLASGLEIGTYMLRTSSGICKDILTLRCTLVRSVRS